MDDVAEFARNKSAMKATLHFQQGDVVSYNEMCLAMGASLQRGMNFRLPNGNTVILMSRRRLI